MPAQDNRELQTFHLAFAHRMQKKINALSEKKPQAFAAGLARFVQSQQPLWDANSKENIFIAYLIHHLHDSRNSGL